MLMLGLRLLPMQFAWFDQVHKSGVYIFTKRVVGHAIILLLLCLMHMWPWNVAALMRVP
jgi:hypothetical protein